MICKKPFWVEGAPVQCGRCIPCLQRERSIWQTRQDLEAACHSESCFITLTFSPEALNKYAKKGVSPFHLTRFLKKLRKKTSGSLRYFAIGEYGDQTWRPHYHLNLFGFSLLESILVEDAWCWDGQANGHVHVAPYSTATARYLTGYVLKRWDKRKLCEEKGLRTEFRRMSKGLGLPAVPTLARAIANANSEEKWMAIENSEWSPMFLRQSGKMRPLGRYLAEKIAVELGIEEAWRKRKENYKEECAQELWDMYNGSSLDEAVDFEEKYRSRREGVVAQIEGKVKAFQLRRTL